MLKTLIFVALASPSLITIFNIRISTKTVCAPTSTQPAACHDFQVKMRLNFDNFRNISFRPDRTTDRTAELLKEMNDVHVVTLPAPNRAPASTEVRR